MTDTPSEDDISALWAKYEKDRADSIRWQHRWEEKSPEGIDPLNVQIQLSTEMQTGQLRNLAVRVHGIRHPYDKEGEYNFIGNSVMNPALVPARDLLANRLPTLINEALAEEGITRSIDTSSQILLNGSKKHAATLDGFDIVLHMNPQVPVFQQDGFTPASDEQIYSLCDRLRTKIDALMPEVRETIATHKDKHPPMPPTRESELGFHASVEGSWTSAMASAKNEGPCELVRKDETPFRK